MNEDLTKCEECCGVVTLDHFDDETGKCEFEDLREVLNDND